MQDFFEAYRAAFDALNADDICSMYTLPCATCDGDGSQVFSELPALRAKFEKNCRMLREMGYKSSGFNIIKEQALGPVAKSLELDWCVTTDRVDVNFSCLYICHLQQGKWRIFSAQVFQKDTVAGQVV